MGVCDGCGAELIDAELYRVGECGKKYCEQCAIADGVIKTLVYAQTAKRSMKLKKTTGAGSNRPIRRERLNSSKAASGSTELILSSS